MSFHTPPHKHVGDDGKPGQTVYLEMDPKRVLEKTLRFYERYSTPGHLSSSDNIPSPLSTQTGKGSFVPLSHIIKDEDLPAGVRKSRTDGDRLLETFAGAAACKLWWWPTDNGR